jgi:hypothetical protein
VTELPDSVGECSALERLQLFNCWALTVLPESIGRLQGLQLLNVGECPLLSELPGSVVRLHLLGEVCTTHRLRHKIPGYTDDQNGTVVLHTDQEQNIPLRNYLHFRFCSALTLVLAMRRKKMKRALPELFEWLWREFIEPQP